jgi:protein disulfide-isomerase
MPWGMTYAGGELSTTMKRLFPILAALALVAGCERPPGEEVPQPEAQSSAASDWLWMTDYEEARRMAAEQKKPVLLNFTGSDWCPPCIQLKKDVFDTREFKSFAQENLVLVELDFPRRKKMDPAVARQNQALQREYKIEGYPTVVLLNPDGTEVKRRSGFGGGGPGAFIEWTRL